MAIRDMLKLGCFHANQQADCPHPTDVEFPSMDAAAMLANQHANEDCTSSVYGDGASSVERFQDPVLCYP